MRKIHVILLAVFTTGVLCGGIGTGIAFGEYSSMEYGGTVMLGEEYLVTGELMYEFDPVPGEKIALNPTNWGTSRGTSNLVMDETLPMGTVCYDVTYNSKLTIPHLYYWESEEGLEEEDIFEAGETETGNGMEINEASIDEADAVEETGAGEEEDVGEETDAGEKADAAEEAVTRETTKEKKKSRVVGQLELGTNYRGNEFELFLRSKERILEDMKNKKFNSFETAYITDVKIRVNPEMMDYIEDRTMY